MSRFLVTGGKGFIGKHLTRFLQERFDASLVTSVGREFDLREPGRARELFQGFGAFDYIIHLADVQGDARWSAQNAAAQFLANAKISLNVLEAWHLWQAQARLICLSSLWAYPEAVVDAEEKDYWNGRMHRPTEHYGLNKKFLGVGLEACKRQHGLKGAALVLGSVYGPVDAAKATGAASRRINTNLASQTTGWPANFKLHTLQEGLQKTVNSFIKSNG
jgi:nucleoside-diphosphate-sugar epimerase